MTDRVRTVDMSDPAVVLDCYKKLNVAYKELKAENEKLRAALKPFAANVDQPTRIYEHEGVRMVLVDQDVLLRLCRTAAAALENNNV